MTTGLRAGASPLLLALMVANGAIAGNLSPISSIGLIVAAQMAKAGLTGHEWASFAANFTAHTLVAIGAYVAFGGLKLLRQGKVETAVVALAPFTTKHWLTLGVIAVWILCV